MDLKEFAANMTNNLDGIRVKQIMDRVSEYGFNIGGQHIFIIIFYFFFYICYYGGTYCGTEVTP